MKEYKPKKKDLRVITFKYRTGTHKKGKYDTVTMFLGEFRDNKIGDEIFGDMVLEGTILDHLVEHGSDGHVYASEFEDVELHPAFIKAENISNLPNATILTKIKNVLGSIII